jgi:hypothetical protein
MTNKEKFLIYHAENPHVYEMFRRFTLEAIQNGRKTLSAWLIINRMRWETMILTTGDSYKLDNGHIAYYARMFMDEFPIYDGFFKTKRLKDEGYEDEDSCESAQYSSEY